MTATRISTKTIFALLLLAMLAAAVWLTPQSQATRSLSSPASDNAKRRRPDFVPGEALVRFKKNSAFEGKAVLNAARKDSPPLASQTQDVEPIAVQIDRFAGSDLIDGLRIARMSEADTLRAVAALNARDDVLYAEPNYIVRTDATPNDPRFLSNELYGLNLIAAPQA